MSGNLAEELRELGDDHGRPLPDDADGLMRIGDRVRRRRRVAGVLVIGATCAVLAVAVTRLPMGGSETTYAIAAPAVFDRAAQAARNAPAPGPGQYVHISRRVVASTKAVDDFFITEDRWIPADPTAKVWSSAIESTTANPSEAEKRLRRGGILPLPLSDYAEYPRDAEGLLRHLQSSSNSGPLIDRNRDTAYALVAFALMEEAPADFRAAAVEALKLLPFEQRVVPDARVGDKTGLGLVLTYDPPADSTTNDKRGVQYTLLVDEASGLILGVDHLVGLNATGGFPTGSTHLMTVTADRSIVDSVPEWTRDPGLPVVKASIKTVFGIFPKE